jgi:hypothetical protein
MTTKAYEVPADKLKFVKAILEAADKKDPQTGKWIANEWALRGYKLNDAKGLGLEGTNYYIYVKADDDFFKRNEKSIIDTGAKLLSGEHASKIIKKVEEAEESAEAGIGAIFG